MLHAVVSNFFLLEIKSSFLISKVGGCFPSSSFENMVSLQDNNPHYTNFFPFKFFFFFHFCETAFFFFFLGFNLKNNNNNEIKKQKKNRKFIPVKTCPECFTLLNCITTYKRG